MVVKRVLGEGFLLAAGMALVYDAGMAVLSDGDFAFTALGNLWFELHPASLNGAQAGIQRYLSSFLWDPVISTILQMPVWVAFCALGLLLLGLSQPKRSDHSATT